ncbi:MAG: hypothetical protein HY951_10865 [Bacteroidia bacterium]|nr:hypothetical protein [Bacteroidia bacterium]
MKYFNLFVIILSICLNNNSFSQDIIYTKDFVDTIECKIVRDNIISLEFRYWNNSDTTIHVLKANEIEYYLTSEKRITDEKLKINVDTSRLQLSDYRFLGDSNKTIFYYGPTSLEEILKANIKGHIELKRKIQFRYIYPSGLIVLVKYNFDVNGIGNSRVGLGGGKLKPFLVNDKIVLKDISTYSSLRIWGLLTMYPIPCSIMLLGALNDGDVEVFLPVAIASYLAGKIIYHFIANSYLRKTINRHNDIVEEMRKTQ